MGRWEGYPEFFSSLGDAFAEAQAVFWVCESERIHAGWKTTLTRDSERAIHIAVTDFGVVASDPSEPNCGCSGYPSEEWRRVLLGEVPWEGPAEPV